jgi:hypothetical protein
MDTTFQRATLSVVALVKGATAREPARFSDPTDTIEVQFNPTSLKLQHANNADAGGVTATAQPRQNPAVRSTVLSFDLEYDTAELDGVDVRTRTAAVRRFAQSPKDKPKSPPPLVRFQWGKFTFNGRVTSVSEDIDYFSPSGTPLRAKVSVSITEQDPSLEAGVKGPAARTDDAAKGMDETGSRSRPTSGRPGVTPPPGSGPGQRGTAGPRQVLPAIGGETLQDLARRAGGSAAAWRSLANGIDDPLNLVAGAGVEVGAEIDAAAGGLGLTVGFADGVAIGSGLADDAAAVIALASAAAGDLLAAGLALTSTGGIATAAGQLASITAAAQADAARASFSVPPAAASFGASPATSPGVPPAGSASTSGTSTGPVAAATAPPAAAPVDPRAVAYGKAIPLRARPQISTATSSQAGGSVSLTARARPSEIPVSSGSGVPWEQLNPGAPGRDAADRAQRSRDARPGTMRWRPGGDCR